MASIRGRMEFPDHMHPGQSGKADGALSHLLYGNDSGKLEAHGHFFPDNGNVADSSSNEGAPIAPQAAWALAGAAAVIIGTKVASSIKSRLEEKRSKRDRPPGHNGAESEAASSGLATFYEHKHVGASKEVNVAAEDPGIVMSNTEWQERYRAMLIAGVPSEEQWRMLSTARIEDTDISALETQSAMGALTAQQLSDRISSTLAANPSSRDEGDSAEFVRILEGRIIEDDHLPARRQKSKETPLLADGEM